MDPYILQKQVRDNSEDIRTFMSELKSWEIEMKRKDKELSEDTSDHHEIPPIRSKAKKSKQVNLGSLPEKEAHPSKRISSYDYSAWDKFDVDKACADIDDGSDKDEDKESVEGDEVDLESVKETSVDSAKLQEQALYEKELGNEHVKNRRWTEAIKCYSKAIECNPYDAIFYANRALCYLKIKKAKFAEMDCSSAIRLDNSYVKAYQRRALARLEMGHKPDAREDFRKVLELEPNNAAAKSELAKLDKPPSTVPKDKKIVLKYVDSQNKKAVVKEAKQEKGPLKSSTSVKQMECREEVLGGGGDADSLKPNFLKEARGLFNSPLIEDGIKVTPIHKPPHLRSKKSLKEVNVVEVDTFDELPDILGSSIKGAPRITVIEETSRSPLLSKEVIKHEEADQISKQERLQSNNKNVTIVPATSEKDPCNSSRLFSETKNAENSSLTVPPVPTSSVQFFTAWRTVKSNPVLRFQYLKQVPGPEFPSIFQESLESKEFGEILSSLNTDFIEEEEPVYSHLLGLSQVKRFSALVMFLSKAEKTVIKKLLQYSEERRHCSKEETDNLKKRYEIS